MPTDTQAEWYQGQNANPLAAATAETDATAATAACVCACDQHWTCFHKHIKGKKKQKSTKEHEARSTKHEAQSTKHKAQTTKRKPESRRRKAKKQKKKKKSKKKKKAKRKIGKKKKTKKQKAKSKKAKKQKRQKSNVGECTPYLTDWWLPLRELLTEMPISSSDDTQVVAQVRLGKLVRYRAKVTIRPDPCLVVLCSVCILLSKCCFITVGRVLSQVW